MSILQNKNIKRHIKNTLVDFSSKFKLNAILIIASLLQATNTYAATYYSISSGYWSSNSTWSLSPSGSAVGTGIYPGDGDIVIIQGNKNVTLAIDAECSNLQVGNNGTGSLSFGTSTSISLTVSGNVIVNSGSQITSITTGKNAHKFYIGGNVSCAGYWDMYGKNSIDDIDVIFNGTNQSISGTGSFEWNSLTIYAGSYIKATSSAKHTLYAYLTINGVLDFGTATFNRNKNGGSLNVNGTMILGSNTGGQNGSNFPNNFSSINLSNGTVIYNYSGSQTVYAKASYNNLTLSGSGTKTTANTDVSGTMSMEGSATTTGTINFGSNSTLQYKGSSSITTSNDEFPTNFIGSGGVIIDQGIGKTVTLNASKTIYYGDLQIKSGTLNLSSYTINRATNGGSLNILENATLKIGGTNTFPTNYATHSIPCQSTTEYAGTNQTVANLNSSQSYGNLILSGSGTKTLLTGTTGICNNFTITGTANTSAVVGLIIGGDVLIDPTALFTAGSYSHYIGGNWTKYGAFNSTNSTIIFNGTSNQTIGTSNFNSIRFSNGGTKTASGILTTTGTLTINSNFNASTFNHILGGSWVNNGNFSPSTGTITLNSTELKTIGGSSNTTFNNLIVNNSSGINLENTTTVSKVLTLTNGKLNLGIYNLIIPSGGSISGASANNYICTNSTGRLTQNVTSGGIIFSFPIGNSSYNPISISSNATGEGNVADFSFRVEDGALTNTNINSKTVNRKWYLTSSSTGITTLTVSPTYNTGETGSNFNVASSPKVGFFTGSAWGYAPATKTGTGPFTLTSSGSSLNVTDPNGYLALGSEDAFNASKFSLTVLPPTPYKGVNSSIATVQSHNSAGVPTWLLYTTTFDLSSNKLFTRADGLTDFSILSTTHETIINNVEFLESTFNTGTSTYELTATVTASRTSGENLSDGITPYFAILDGSTYRPKTSGSWSSVQWQKSTDGGNNWFDSALPANNEFGQDDVIQIPVGVNLTADVSTTLYSMLIFGTLDLTSSGILTIHHSLDNLSDYDLKVYGTLKNSGGTITNSNLNYVALEFLGGTYWHNMNGGSIPVASWKTINNIKSTCKITGIATTAITAGLNQNFQHFIWDNALQNTVQSLNSNLSINGTLTLANGVISTSTNFVILSAESSATSENNSRIDGNLRRHIPISSSPTVFFPIGDSLYFTPATINFNGTIGSNGYLDVSTRTEQPAFSSGLSQVKYINRMWSIINTGVSGFTSYNPTFTFVNEDQIGSPNTSSLVIRKLDSGYWSNTTNGTRTANSTQCTGLITFSDFAIGEDDCSSTNYIWLGRTNTDWNTASNWCYNQVPSSSVDVVIPNGPTNQPTIGSSNATCKNLTIMTGATLTIANTNTLNIKGSLTNSGTFTTNSSTVSFSGTSTQTITGSTTFHNITVNNTNGVIATSNLTVNGILNLASANPSSTVGAFSMGTKTMNMGPDATNVGIGDVTGSVLRTDNFTINKVYTFGNPYSSILFNAVAGVQTFPSSINVHTSIGSTYDWGTTTPLNPVKRIYTVSITGNGSGNHCTIKTHYSDSEITGGVSENALSMWFHVPTTDITKDKGKSNYSTTDNYIAISDMDFAIIPATLQLAVAASSNSAYTWNGSQSTNWDLATNWTPQGVPGTENNVVIPNASTTDFDPSIPTIAYCQKISIERGGILNAVNDAQLQISGYGNIWYNESTNGVTPAGMFNAGTSNIILTNTFENSTIIGETDFFKLTVLDNVRLQMTAGSYIGISGSLYLSSNGILDARTFPNTIEFKGLNPIIPKTNYTTAGYHNLTINNSSTGTITWPTTLFIGGNLTNNKVGTIITGTTEFNGIVAQYINGSESLISNNLTINNPQGVISNIDIKVNSVLNLIYNSSSSNDKGALSITDPKVLSMGLTSTTIGLGEVSGIINRAHIFETGTFYSFGFQHTGVTFADVSGYPGQVIPTSISLKTILGSTPDWSTHLGPIISNPINRSCDLIQTGGQRTRALIQVNYNANQIPAGINENDLTIWTASYIPAYNNFYNKESGKSGMNTDLKYIAIQDVDFAILPEVWNKFKSTLAPSAALMYTWTGAVNTSWNNPSNWTPNGVPDATHGAIIPNTYTTPFAPTLPASATCLSMQINAGGVLVDSIGSILTLTATNTAWNVEDGGVFIPNNSTVVFNANALSSGNISINGSTDFNNVTISSGSLLRPAQNCYMGINGTLNIEGTLAAATNKNTIEFKGNNTQTIPNPNGSKTGYYNLKLSGSGTKNLPETLNIVGDFTNNATGTVNSGTGTIIFDGSYIINQNINGISATNFYNLTINNPLAKTISNSPINVINNLEITTKSSLNMELVELGGSLNSISGTGTLCTKNQGSTPIPAGKTWTGTVDFNGTVVQTVVPGTYNILTISNIAGANLGGDITVNETLDLPNNNPTTKHGVLETNQYILNMGIKGTNAAITKGLGDVTGTVKRAHTFIGNTIYTFGNQHTNITFVDFPGTTKPGWISCKIAIDTIPAWKNNAVRRQYTFAKDAGDDRTVLNLHYLDSELNTDSILPYEPDASKLQLWDAHNGPTFLPIEVHGKSMFDATNKIIGLAGMSIGYIAPTSDLDFKQWVLGYSNITKIKWLGTDFDANDWALPGNWEGGIPTASDDVLIPAGAPSYPTKNSDPATYPSVAKTFEIEPLASVTVNNYDITIYGTVGAWSNSGNFEPGTGTVTFANDTITNIASISGTTNFYNLNISDSTYIQPAEGSIIRILNAINPGTASVLDFTASQNTIDYIGSNQSIINYNGSSNNKGYHDLIISGSGTTTLPTLLNIAGDFINNGTIEAGTGTVIIKDQGHIQNIGGTTRSSFYNLIIDNTDQIVTASNNFNVNNSLTINSNTALEMGIYELGGSLSSTNGTGVLKTKCTSATPIPNNINWSFKVIYENHTTPQTTASGIYESLQISNPYGTTSAGTLNCNSLTIDKNSVLDMSTYALLNVGTINGTGTLKTQNISATPIPAGKSWTGAIEYNGSAAQTAVAGLFENIGIDNASGVIVSDSAIINGTLLINSGKKMVINPGAQISSQFVKNHAGVAGITLKSSASTPNGTLIFKNTSEYPVSATVEMYSKASWDLSNQTPGGKYKWQFFGIPVKTLTAFPLFSGAFVRLYNEAGNGSGTTSNKRWIQLVNASTLSPFKTYEVVQENAKTYSFQGQILNNDYLESLIYTPTSDYPGQHLISNPYTAAIDIKQLSFGTGLDQTVYLYNTGSLTDWSTQTGLDGNPGQYIAVPKNLAGLTGLPSQIPSMQGFLIKMLETTPSTFGISYNSVATRNKQAQRVKSSTESRKNILTYIEIRGSKFKDNMWIVTNDECTHNFDNGWDGSKFIGTSVSPQIFAIEPQGNYQVNAINDINNSYIGFIKGEDSEYTLVFNHENSELKYQALYLIDLLTNKTIDITQSGSTYEFVAEQTTESTKRFKIVTNLGITTESTKILDSKLSIFSSQKAIYIKNDSDKNGILDVFDSAGRKVTIINFNENCTTVQSTNLPTGAYIGRTIIDNKIFTENFTIQ